jgi:LSD1 subclass zinc finger protein
MRKIKDAIIKFFYGRNGVDSLNKFIFILYLASTLAYIITNHISALIVESIFLFILIYRTLSKKLYKRQRENEIYLNILKLIKRPFLRLAHRIRDRKTHVYKKCPSCKKILKLKKVKGHHRVKCPICKNSFEIKIK